MRFTHNRFVDLYQLRYFLEAARERSFTRAAENLHVSPSAVSRSVALLERSVGKRLFARTKRSVTPTKAGEALKVRAERVFDEVERARLELSEEDAAPELLRLGSREMITNYLLPGPLARFQEAFPRTRFEAYDLEPDLIAEALEKDQLDLGFYYAELPDPALECRFLGRLRSRVYASKGYLRRRGAIRSLRDTLRQPFVAPRAFGGDPALPRADGFPDRRYPRLIQYEAESLEAHRRFVLGGLCVGVLPELVMEGRSDVVAVAGPPLHRDIYALSRRGRALPKPVASLVDAVRAQIRRLAR